ncbi:MAG: hypothetical protein LBH58_07070, partial [Tannerellaceae bacterium]|nr:hypothetical protein [Tannerellaceae bacterium]
MGERDGRIAYWQSVVDMVSTPEVHNNTASGPKAEQNNENNNEVDENGYPFITINGSIDLGEIKASTGLAEAPIRLSEGYQDETTNKGYGLKHIEKEHGDQILNAGFSSIEEFVAEVAKNYQTIKEGNKRGTSQTYLLEVADKHNNTLFVELSKDGNYWSVNSAGIFNERYSDKKKTVWTLPAVSSSANAYADGVNDGTKNGVTVTSGNSPQSDRKGNENDSKNNNNETQNVTENTPPRFQAEQPADRDNLKKSVLEAFHNAEKGLFTGKSIPIGDLTEEGKKYLSELSGLDFRNTTTFELNPSDLRHIYNNHYGKNEKDTGKNIPLTDSDIGNMVEVIYNPEQVVYLGEDKKTGNKVFAFIKSNPLGTYNLMEVYGNSGGKLTVKSFYNTKKGSDQRVMELKSLLPTSETYSGASLSGTNVPQLFQTPKPAGEKTHVSGEKMQPATREEVEHLVKQLNKKGLARNVFIDEAKMREYLEKDYEKVRKQSVPVVEDATEDQIQVNGQWYSRAIYSGWEALEVGDEVKGLNANKPQKKERTPIDNNLIKAAKEVFGITDDFEEAGYLLTDGAMLDFSGKRDGGSPHARSYDHREINSFEDSKGNEYEPGMYGFMDIGNIRMKGNGFELSGKPTDEQLRILRRFVRYNNGDVYVDFTAINGDDVRNEDYAEYNGASADRVINDIIRYYDEGIRPTNVRYMRTSKGEVYGFTTPEGDVYLDPNRMNLNTPIHEFGHLYWDVMPQEMKDEITELLKQTPGWNDLSDNPAYADLKTDDQKADELFNTLLGNYGEANPQVMAIAGDNTTLLSRIQHAINEFLQWLKATVFGDT